MSAPSVCDWCGKATEELVAIPESVRRAWLRKGARWCKEAGPCAERRTAKRHA